MPPHASPIRAREGPEQVTVLIAAIPLTEAPEVARFLGALGLGAFDPGSVQSFVGRNDIWAGVTDAGAAVFVKRVDGRPTDARRRLRRMEVMANALNGHAVLSTPRCLGIDPAARLAAFELLDGAVSCAELLATGELRVEHARRAGRMIGALHALAPPAAVVAERSRPPLPPLGKLVALPLVDYALATGAELEVWGLVHDDDELVAAIRRVRRDEERCAPVLVHGDLRLDQLLLHDGRLHVTDWEECGLADPARDVGAVAGEFLYRGVLGMAATAEGDDSTDRDVISGGVDEFQRLRPFVAAFWSGYLASRPDAGGDRDMVRRAAAFAGWHLFDRILARASRRAVLPALERAAAGVGRTALLAPDLVSATIGLGESR